MEFVVNYILFHLDTEAKSYTQAYQGQGPGPVFLIYHSCNGDEESIFNCMLNQNPSSCTNDEVAGVVCIQSELHSFSISQSQKNAFSIIIVKG